MVLSCKHEERVTEQVQPTIDLLADMDVLHPDILLQHAIRPTDYKSGLVFRSAIESIRGSFIASSTTGREGLVKDVLENLVHRSYIVNYAQNSSRARYDFTITLEQNPDRFAAIEFLDCHRRSFRCDQVLRRGRVDSAGRAFIRSLGFRDVLGVGAVQGNSQGCQGQQATKEFSGCHFVIPPKGT